MRGGSPKPLGRPRAVETSNLRCNLGSAVRRRSQSMNSCSRACGSGHNRALATIRQKVLLSRHIENPSDLPNPLPTYKVQYSLCPEPLTMQISHNTSNQCQHAESHSTRDQTRYTQSIIAPHPISSQSPPTPPRSQSQSPSPPPPYSASAPSRPHTASAARSCMSPVGNRAVRTVPTSVPRAVDRCMRMYQSACNIDPRIRVVRHPYQSQGIAQQHVSR